MPSMIATLSPGWSCLGQRLADAPRSGAVVRADERHLQPLLLQHLGIELVVDVDDEDARVAGRASAR